MIKNRLAIDVFYEFVKNNGKIPTYKEFMELGYSKRTYYRMRTLYYENEKENKENEVKGDK